MQVHNKGARLLYAHGARKTRAAGNEKRYYLRLADEDLISLVGAGDAFAFTALYDRHSRSTYSLARRLTGDEQDAKDLAQDAFLKVWRSAGSYWAERGSVRPGCSPWSATSA